MFDPQTPVAVVTGAAQGIGKGIAKQLLADGMTVVLTDCDIDALNETTSELGGKSLSIPLDVADETSVASMAKAVSSRTSRLEVLVNNAGITNPVRKNITTLELAEWNRIIGTNLTGAFLCTKYLAPLLAANHGSIINIASTRALQSEADTEAYSASKGGLVALTHALAISLGPEVRVNCISPGWIDVSQWQKSAQPETIAISEDDHRQHPAGRVGRPEDIAAMVSFLASDKAGFITGQNYIVDGGMTRKMIYIED